MIVHENFIKLDVNKKRNLNTELSNYIWVFVMKNYPTEFEKFVKCKVRIRRIADLRIRGIIKVINKGESDERYEIILGELFISLNYEKYPNTVYDELNKEIVKLVYYLRKKENNKNKFNLDKELSKHTKKQSTRAKTSKGGYDRGTSSLHAKYRYRCPNCKESYYKNYKEKVYKCIICKENLYYTNRYKLFDKR